MSVLNLQPFCFSGGHLWFQRGIPAMVQSGGNTVHVPLITSWIFAVPYL